VLLRLQASESLTWEGLAERAGLSSRQLFRLLAARTVSELVADRIACRIGLRPALLWPNEWFRQEHPRRRGRLDVDPGPAVRVHYGCGYPSRTNLPALSGTGSGYSPSKQARQKSPLEEPVAAAGRISTYGPAAGG
jgi:hypothetical protein